MIIDKSNPFPAKIKERYPLTKPGSTKTTYHIVLDLKESGMTFKVGDSIGIFGENDPLLVDRLLVALQANGDEVITESRSGNSMSLRHFLTRKANLSRLTPSFLKVADPNHPLLNDKAYLASHDTLEFLQTHPNLPLQEVVNQFAPLLPRFYSIASSLKTHPDELHLTVALSQYEHKGELRYGVASHFLCHLAKENDTPILSYVQPTPHFTIPVDLSAPMIMVGPGTGIAPFRGFLHERLAQSAPGKHWLFFGERHRKFDFFYEDFWSSLVDNQKLRLDLAFSRDQAEKHYVQHKMMESGEELWSWLQEGAYFYICGEADPMAKEVEATLIQIFCNHGKLDIAGAKAYLKSLRHQKRYLADVY